MSTITVASAAPEPSDLPRLLDLRAWPHDTVVVRPGDAPKVHELLERHGLAGQYEVHESPFLVEGAYARASDPGTG